MEGARRPGRRMTLEEFLVWESGDDRRYELIDGELIMMAPPSEAHGTIAMNLGRVLGNALAGRRPCRVVGEAAIARSNLRDRCFQADLAMTCAPPERGRRIVSDPILIAEILSRSTESGDRSLKVPDYRAMPSVREILLIDQDRAFVELLRRLEGEGNGGPEGDRWLTILAIGADAKLMLESIPMELRLSDLYRDVDLVAEGSPDFLE